MALLVCECVCRGHDLCAPCAYVFELHLTLNACCRYVTLYDTNPWLLKLWVPLVMAVVVSVVVLSEGRLAYGFIFEDQGSASDGLF